MGISAGATPPAGGDQVNPTIIVAHTKAAPGDSRLPLCFASLLRRHGAHEKSRRGDTAAAFEIAIVKRIPSLADLAATYSSKP
jgi:hypothetical protein